MPEEIRIRVPQGGLLIPPDLPALSLKREERIRTKYEALGGAAALGEPTSKEPGEIWTFSNGSCICYDRHTSAAYQIYGSIYAKWLALGGLKFGAPCTDESSCPDGIGRFNHFNGNQASIYWTAEYGAWAIYGGIRAKWAEMGWEASVLGYPVSDETETPDGIGRFNHFSNQGSIYWTPQLGAHALWGAIRAHWEALGWERSYLGYPVTDEVPFAQGGRATEFEHGGIYWWADTGPIDLRDVVVHYTGLYCFGETDWDQSSSADEPYIIISVTTPQLAHTVTSQVYQDVDAGEARPDLVEVYRGRPYGMNIGTVVMESDFGDPNRYKEEVHKVVMGAHSAGTLALGLIPVVGPFIAAVAGPGLGALMPAVSGAINDLFDWGDDRIGGATMTVPARDMVLLAARGNNSTFHGIGYRVESPIVAGDGASYKVYFGIVPA